MILTPHVATITAAALVAVPATGVAQPDVTTLIARASAYVAAYERDIGLVVSDERYEQTVRSRRPFGVDNARVVLRSDFLLVRMERDGWVPFRDVFERNGVSVRDREDRLTRLFLSGTPNDFEQVRRIVAESSRYNIGRIDRTINVPTLPLRFLAAGHLARMDYRYGRADAGVPGLVVDFRETGRPTLITTREGKDQPMTGRFWIDEATGAVLRSELTAENLSMVARIDIVYELHPGLNLRVPVRMEEHYSLPLEGYEVRGVATYSQFRRFSVTTSDEMVEPGDAKAAPREQGAR